MPLIVGPPGSASFPHRLRLSASALSRRTVSLFAAAGQIVRTYYILTHLLFTRFRHLLRQQHGPLRILRIHGGSVCTPGFSNIWGRPP